MNRKDQLKQLISLSQDKIESCQNLITNYQKELEEICLTEDRPMDQELRELQRQLAANPDDFKLRQRATACGLRARQGIFAAWRNTSTAAPDTEVVEIEQPMFISENSLETAPLIKQAWNVSILNDSITDLLQILPLQPAAIITLPKNGLYYFNSLPKIASDFTDDGRLIKYHVIYDTGCVLPGLTQINFFQRPLGATDDQTQITKTLVETNMYTGGSLPYPMQFEIHGISIIPMARSTLGEHTLKYETVVNFLQSSWFRFFIGASDWMVAPSIAMGTTTSRKTPGFGFQLSNPMEPIHTLPQPTRLVSNQNFRVELNSTYPFRDEFKIMAMLHGFMTYPANSMY